MPAYPAPQFSRGAGWRRQRPHVLAAGLVLATGLALFGPNRPAEATTPPAPEQALVVDSQRTVLIGDSISKMGRNELAVLAPHWTLDTISGSRVPTLQPRLAQYVKDNGRPERVVIALGTNARFATKQLYLDAVATLPRSTEVVFVTSYRNRAHVSGHFVFRMKQISGWMRSMAEDSPRTCFVPWREAMLRSGGRLLYDGTHPGPTGQRLWADEIVATVETCR